MNAPAPEKIQDGGRWLDAFDRQGVKKLRGVIDKEKWLRDFRGLQREIGVFRDANLRAQIEALGGSNVRTLQNSGNVVFSIARASETTLTKKIVARIESTFGFSSRVVVMRDNTLREVVAANPLSDAIMDPAKFLVGFVTEKSTLTDLKSLSQKTWLPDQFAIGSHACYLACASGFSQATYSKPRQKSPKKT